MVSHHDVHRLFNKCVRIQTEDQHWHSGIVMFYTRGALLLDQQGSVRVFIYSQILQILNAYMPPPVTLTPQDHEFLRSIKIRWS